MRVGKPTIIVRILLTSDLARDRPLSVVELVSWVILDPVDEPAPQGSLPVALGRLRGG